MNLLRTPMLTAVGLTVLAALSGSPAVAAPNLVVGKAVSFAWTFTPMEVGEAEGIWAKYGIEPKVIALGGGAKVAQALTARSIDIALTGGPVLGFMAKGVPAKGVAVAAGEPHSMAVVVPYDSPIKSAVDLKGTKMGVTTVGSLTAWMTRRVAVSEGWGPDGIKLIALGGGGLETYIAALKLHEVDALMLDPSVGYALQEKHEGRNLVDMSKFVKHFITHVILVRNQLIAKRPELVKNFLKGWFATIAFMRTHKADTVAITSRVLKQDKHVMSQTYDREMPEMSTNGVFEPAAVETLKQSLVEMHILSHMPKDSALFTTRFVPVKF